MTTVAALGDGPLHVAVDPLALRLADEGPIMFAGSAGSPTGTPAIVATVCSTASSSLDSGTSRRLVMAHPWPACEQIVKPANMPARSSGASSITMKADLPPSSRNTCFTVALAAAMMLPARGRGTGEADHVDQRAGDQRLAHRDRRTR